MPSYDDIDVEQSGVSSSKHESRVKTRNLKFRASPPYQRKPLMPLDGRLLLQFPLKAVNASILPCVRDNADHSPLRRSNTGNLMGSPNRIHGSPRQSPRSRLNKHISVSKQKSYRATVMRDVSNALSRLTHWLRKRNKSARSSWFLMASFLLWFTSNLGLSHFKFIRSSMSQPPRKASSSGLYGKKAKSSKRVKEGDTAFLNTKSEGFREADLPQSTSFPRVFDLSPSRLEKQTGSKMFSILARRVPVMEFERHEVEEYPAEFSDNTQLYHIMDSSDVAIQESMELREPYVQGECVPMKEWQTTFHPTCNSQHEFDLQDSETILFGTNGYWRDAWRLEHSLFGANSEIEKVVLKTLKYSHRFEDKYFEHNRVDAVAMERLTSSKHVMDVYSYCGNSVFMEFAGGQKFSALADKARGAAKIRLARDIAEGIADVHSIDGDKYASLTHFDINLSNIGVVNDAIKLNDFNIAVLRKWNTTSDQPCGFPSRYPNPQWRSPEEARDSQLLTEKVDVYSMGNIFFRLICRHEPWNTYEKGGKPPKEEMNAKVQAGILPQIPTFILESTDFATVAIREAMLAAYTTDPNERPSARSIANDLNRALRIAEASESE